MCYNMFKAMQPNMRKAALTLVRKMAHFCPPDLLLSLCSTVTEQSLTSSSQDGQTEDKIETEQCRMPRPTNTECSQLAVQLVQVIAAVLDNEVIESIC